GAPGIALAQFAERSERLGLVPGLVESVGLPVERAVGLAPVDLDDLVEAFDGVIKLAVIQGIFGFGIKLILVGVGFLRGLWVKQGSGGEILERRTGGPRRKCSASQEQGDQE